MWLGRNAYDSAEYLRDKTNQCAVYCKSAQFINNQIG